MDKLISNIRQTLKDSIDEKTLKNEKNFFKEEIKSYGVKVPVVNTISKSFFNAIKDKYSKTEIWNLCSVLWQSGYIEESFIACNLSYYIHKQYEPADFEIFEEWILGYVTNWASCDTLCNHTVGEFLEMYPDYISRLKIWAKSKNRWVRRAAAVSLIIPARKGLFFKDIIDIADILLLDADDLVQKGYGWMLKAASETNQQEVFNYIMSKKEVMPRTSLRYAIEKMPVDLKVLAMEKTQKSK